jgi:hypothetical protein
VSYFLCSSNNVNRHLSHISGFSSIVSLQSSMPSHQMWQLRSWPSHINVESHGSSSDVSQKQITFVIANILSKMFINQTKAIFLYCRCNEMIL